MTEIIRELTLDVARENRQPAVLAKQYDSQSRFLLVKLENEGTPLRVDANATVTLNVRRSDDAKGSFLGTVEADGRVKVPLTYWALMLEGLCSCDISVTDGEERKLSTTSFTVMVQRANSSEEVSEDDEDYENFGTLTALISEVTGIQQEEQTRLGAESARAAAEQSRVQSETARASAETARATGYAALKNTMQSEYAAMTDAMQSDYETLTDTMQTGYDTITDTMQSEYSTMKSTMQSGYTAMTNTMQTEYSAMMDDMQDICQQAVALLDDTTRSQTISDLQNAVEGHSIRLGDLETWKDTAVQSLSTLSGSVTDHDTAISQLDSQLSGLTQDDVPNGTTYQRVTGTEKTTWNGKYTKPSGGIPQSDLASGVQTTLNAVGGKYVKPSGGIPQSDLSSEVRSLLGGGLSLTLLWTNAAPTSKFAGQTLPISTTGYSMLLYKMTYKSSATDHEVACLVKPGEQGAIFAMDNGTNEFGIRSVGTNGITIQDRGNSMNAYVVPVRVYGIK